MAPCRKYSSGWWLSRIPNEEVRACALKRWSEQGYGNDTTYKSMQQALYYSFDWVYTPENYRFWEKVYFELRDNKQCWLYVDEQKSV